MTCAKKPPAVKKASANNGWMKEHFDDVRARRHCADGYRFQASYKLLEIDDLDRLIAAPGDESQVAMARVNFIQGDFTEEQTRHAMLEALDNRPVNVVLSDMAHNPSG